MNTKIIGGTIVTSNKTYKSDVLISNGKIKRIARRITDKADKIIDAKGQYLFPGGIDVHTHLDMPFGGTVTSDDFYTGTIAAACGGTTSIIDFAMQEKRKSLKDALNKWHSKARGKSVIDYGFHIALTDLNKEAWHDLSQLVSLGVSSVKAFMAYKNSLMVSDEVLFKLLEKSNQYGFLVMIHAENGDAIDVLIKRLLSERKTKPVYHAISRPPELEEEATNRVITLARLAKAPLYIVHLSCKGALRRVRLARKNKQKVYAETCPHYLTLSINDLRKPGFQGAKYVMSPPLRDKSNQQHLWQGLAKGDLVTIGSDHCAFNMKTQKELGKGDFSKIPNGIPGAETRLPLIYSEGVAKKRISLNRCVDICSTTPARLFGLYPQKGEIAIGSDADIVIFNPKGETILKASKLHQKVDYCPYEGMKLKGSVSHVLLRGEVIVKDNKFLGKRGNGKFLKRKAFKPK
jgi:dihydropyrimidinase